MNYTKKRLGWKRLIIPTFLFALAICACLYGDLLLPQLSNDPIQQPYLTIYYSIQVLTYFLGAFLFNRLFRILVWDRLGKNGKDEVPQLLKDIFAGLVYLITSALVASVVFDRSLTGFWATSSVAALIVGFALRNMILDLFTGLAVNIEKPYKVGDWIQIHSHLSKVDIVGHVIDISWRATHIQTEEAKTYIIPNSLITTFIVTNYWKDDPAARFEIFIPIDFAIPVEKARRVLFTGVKRALSESGFVNYKTPTVLVHDVDDRGVIFKIAYWITPWKGTTPAIGKDRVFTFIMKHLNKAGISVAIPKEDVYHAEMPKRNFIDDTTEDRVKILKKIDLFEQMTEEELSVLAKQIEYRFFDEEQTVVTNGEVGDSMFIMIEGVVDVLIKRDQQEEEVSVAELYTNQYFGEMSLLTGEKRSASVRTTMPSVLYEIRKDDLKSLFKSRPQLIDKIAEAMASRKLSNQKILDDMDKKGQAAALDASQSSLIRKIRSFFTIE